MHFSIMSRSLVRLSKRPWIAALVGIILLNHPYEAWGNQNDSADQQFVVVEDTAAGLYKAALDAFNEGRYLASKKMAVGCLTLLEDRAFNQTLLPYAQCLNAKCDFELGNFDTAETEMKSAIYQLKNFGAPPEVIRFNTCDLAAILIRNMRGREAIYLLDSLDPKEKISPRVSYLLGIAKTIVMDYAGAESQLRASLKSVTTHGSDEVDEAEIRQHLGIVLSYTGRLNDGVIECTKAVTSASGRQRSGLRTLALVDLGIAQYRHGQLEKAKSSLEEAINSTSALRAFDSNHRKENEDPFHEMEHPSKISRGNFEGLIEQNAESTSSTLLSPTIEKQKIAGSVAQSEHPECDGQHVHDQFRASFVGKRHCHCTAPI